MPEARPVKTLVAGIGSPILSDDGVGVHAARMLRPECLGGGVGIVEVGAAGLSLLDFVEGFDRLIVLDAIVTGARPGTIHELRGEEAASALHLGAIHEADLPAALALGRKLGKLVPEDVIVIAVEAADVTTFSERLTPEVESALPGVLSMVKSLLKSN